MMGAKPYEKSVNFEREELLKKAAYALNDGIISISALLALFLGLGQRPDTFATFLLIATIAGAISLAVGEIIATRTRKEDFLQEEHDAQMEVHLVPELKKQEIRAIYEYKGFKGEFLDEIVDHIALDEDWLVKELALDEVTLAETQKENELKNGLIGMNQYNTWNYLRNNGFIPNYGLVLIFAIVVVIIGLFVIGALKVYITKIKPLKAGIQMVIIGMVVFSLSYAIGLLLGVMGV